MHNRCAARTGWHSPPPGGSTWRAGHPASPAEPGVPESATRPPSNPWNKLLGSCPKSIACPATLPAISETLFKHFLSLQDDDPVLTVYPRACGGTLCAEGMVMQTLGLSPRVRGNRTPQPVATLSDPSLPLVYPRACGGTVGRFIQPRSARGLSPRVRGNHWHGGPGESCVRSIPARAGEPATRHGGSSPYRVYPRACGGTLKAGRMSDAMPGLSPRVRGNRS